MSDAPSRCCPRDCLYRPEAVEYFLAVIKAFSRANEDVTLSSPGQLLRMAPNGRTLGDQAIAVWDIQMAIQELRAERKEVNSTAVSRRLCPWGME